MGKNSRDMLQRGGMGQSERSQASALSLTIKDFSPMWFVVSMDTGILSIIMNLLPWQFNGLGVLATIMFVWNVVLFSVFTLISLIRILKYPKHVRKESASSIEEISYLGAPAIAYLTLVSQVILTCSTAWGYGLTVFAYVLWWIGLVWTVSLCSGTVVALAKRPITNDHQISPVIFLPLISVMTLGTTGGLLTNYSVGISSAEAVPVIVVSFCCIGYALFLSILYYAIFAHRLMVVGPPQRPKIPALVITVGPLGQFATAIQVLGTAASTGRNFASYHEGTWLTASAAASVSATCELVALLIIGFAFLWISVAWYLVIEALVLRRLSFSMTWWSMIFPMGVFTTSLLNLSIALNSPAFRGLTAALLIFLLIIYFVNLACTLYRIIITVALEVPQRQSEGRKTHEGNGEIDEEHNGMRGTDTETTRNDSV